jgi:hypothetical protein
MTGLPEASAELVDLGAHSVTQTSAHADERKRRCRKTGQCS